MVNLKSKREGELSRVSQLVGMDQKSHTYSLLMITFSFASKNEVENT